MALQVGKDFCSGDSESFLFRALQVVSCHRKHAFGDARNFVDVISRARFVHAAFPSASLTTTPSGTVKGTTGTA
eukprot:2868419-Amphidinium_carterae.1